MAGKLKPCPFCGHDWPLLITHSSDAGNEYSVRCYQGCCEISDEYRDQAIKEWNTRAAPDVNDGLLEALERAEARFAHIRDRLNSGRLDTATRRASFANDVWHMECEARAAIAKAKGEDGEASNG